MKLGSLQQVVGDLDADLTRIGRAISGYQPVRAYRAHPTTCRIVAYLTLGAIAAVAIIRGTTPPSG
jgi:hypothetical protein